MIQLRAAANHNADFECRRNCMDSDENFDFKNLHTNTTKKLCFDYAVCVLTGAY